MDEDLSWHYFLRKPIVMKHYGVWGCGDGSTCLTYWAFNIAPFNGDWKHSLIKVEHKCASSGQVKEEK